MFSGTINESHTPSEESQSRVYSFEQIAIVDRDLKYNKEPISQQKKNSITLAADVVEVYQDNFFEEIDRISMLA